MVRDGQPAPRSGKRRDDRGGIGLIPMEHWRWRRFVLFFSCLLTGCGYHLAGTTNLLPSDIHTIAVVPWANISMEYKLADYLAEGVSRELTTRTRYKIISDPAKADAVLTGAVANLFSSATVSDPATGRSTGAQLVVQVQVRLMDKTGKVVFERPNLEFRERYELSVDPKQYFDESQAALLRLSRDVSRTIVSAMLENF
jgi:outer membrane lipopolysaccharide assembly protein LptE/RlpB